MAKKYWGQDPFKKGTMAQVSEHLQEKMETHVRAKLLDIFTDTIMATPVDTGRLRNNWMTSLGMVDTGIRGGRGKGGASTKGAKEMMGSFELGDTVFFANNLPYAAAIEDGHSGMQAPEGMLKISVRNNI